MKPRKCLHRYSKWRINHLTLEAYRTCYKMGCGHVESTWVGDQESLRAEVRGGISGRSI